MSLELVKSEVTFNPNDSTNSGIVIINHNAKTHPILYNPDAIISVDYHVNSKQATHFQKWATGMLREILKKGSRFVKDFFATVQNMLLFAITGQTAAEIIKSHSDKNKIKMGRRTLWKNHAGRCGNSKKLSKRS